MEVTDQLSRQVAFAASGAGIQMIERAVPLGPSSEHSRVTDQHEPAPAASQREWKPIRLVAIRRGAMRMTTDETHHHSARLAVTERGRRGDDQIGRQSGRAADEPTNQVRLSAGKGQYCNRARFDREPGQQADNGPRFSYVHEAAIRQVAKVDWQAVALPDVA
jgi:hypothetical protein